MDNYNYPMGADTPDAPWNQSDPDPVTQSIEYSCVMRRIDDVKTTDYVPGWTEKEWDGETYVAVHEDADFSDTDWLGEYKDQHCTPSQLIDILRETAKKLAVGKMPKKHANFWQSVIDECENWEIDDEEAEAT